MSVVVRRNIFLIVLGFALVLGGLPRVQAASVSDLYKQDVLVSSQSEQERQAAMERAFVDVIIRVTGHRKALDLPGIRKALTQSSTYVRSYSYRNVTEGNDVKRYLQVSFDLTMVNRLLRESNVAIWGASRPTTLMWLALEEGGRRSVLGSSAELPRIMENHFQARGIPSILPLMDFEDSLNISAVDVWGLFADKLEKASRRYGSEVVLAGRLLKQGERYSGRLNLLFRGQSYQVAVDDLVAAGVAGMAADLVGSVLSSHYAVVSSGDHEKPLLVVDNVSSLEDYAALKKYLKTLTAVRDVAVHKVNGSVIELELSIDGSVAQFSDALALGRSLAKNAEADVDDNYRQRLFYRWIKR